MNEDVVTRILDEVDADFICDLWAKGVTTKELALMLSPKARQTEQEVLRLLNLKAKKQGVN